MPGKNSILLAGLLLPLALSAAEIRGRVLIEGGDPADPPETVSVALIPVDRQPGSVRGIVHEITLHRGRFQPNYLAMRPGERLRLVNLDPVHHRIFSVGPRSVSLALPPSQGKAAETVRITEPGVFHLFCRIHTRAYARIEVLEASRILYVRPGEAFEFDGLAAGRWRLRISGPGLVPATYAAEAFTAPPPRDFTVQATSRTARGKGHRAATGIALETLYPGLPLQ